MEIDTNGGHGPLWIRAALHLHARAQVWLQARGINVSFEDALFGAGPEGIEDKAAYRDALAGELSSKRPVCWHLRQPYPPAFKSLCNGAAVRRGEPLPFPSSPRSASVPAANFSPPKPQFDSAEHRRLKLKFAGFPFCLEGV